MVVAVLVVVAVVAAMVAAMVRLEEDMAVGVVVLKEVVIVGSE